MSQIKLISDRKLTIKYPWFDGELWGSARTDEGIFAISRTKIQAIAALGICTKYKSRRIETSVYAVVSEGGTNGQVGLLWKLVELGWEIPWVRQYNPVVDQIVNKLRDFANSQQPLPPDVAKVLYENLSDLYLTD